MKKILCTGTCGFIFSNFIRQAIREQNHNKEDKYTFVSIDKLNSNPNKSFYQNRSHTFYPADITDQHILDVIFEIEKPDIVIHGAALTFVDASISDPNGYVKNNIVGTQNIINACVKSKVEKMLMISTDEVNGQLENEDDKPWKEDQPLNPRNVYAATKASAELLVQAAHYTYGLNYNITRSSNCYGPWQFPEKLIPKTIKCILNNEKIPIYGEGKQIRDWTHVFDNCSGIMTVLEKGKPNEIYNISANQEFTNIETVHEICKYMGKGDDLISFIKDPRGNSHDFRYSLNTDKLRALGWAPKLQFKKHLGAECIDWFINNQWFLNNFDKQ